MGACLAGPTTEYHTRPCGGPPQYYTHACTTVAHRRRCCSFYIYCVCFYCSALKKFNLPALVRLFSFLPKLPSWRIEPGTSVYETIVLPAELMIHLCKTI